MDRFRHDLRFALRQMRRAPAFTFVVVATLAVGIGVNTSVFSVVNTLLLRPLPWDHAERYVRLSGAYEGRGDQWSVSWPNASDWRVMNRSFEEMGWYQGGSYTLTGGDRPERLAVTRASASLLPLLGADPAAGRLFTAEDDVPDAERVALISHGLWQRRFGGDPDVVGSTVVLSNVAHTVVGVLPEGFWFPSPDVDLYVPVRADESTWNRANGGLQVVGKLREGVTLTAAAGDMAEVSARLAEAYPAPNAELSAHLRSFREAQLGGPEARTMLFTLLGAVGFVLLIACVNVANLLLARATGREREMAVRAALGAGRGRVVGQLVTEALTLAALGGVAGTLASLWGARLFAAAMPADMPFNGDFSLDGTVLLFAVALTALTGVLFGLAPALHASRTDLNTLLAGRAGGQARRRGRRRRVLVVGEVAVAVVLLVGAGLTIRSLTALLATDPGFETRNLLTLRVSLDSRYEENTDVAGYLAAALDAVAAVPGVEAVGAVDFIPLGGTNNWGDVTIAGAAGGEYQNAGQVFAAPGYFAAMGIELQAGRGFTRADTRDAPGVAVVNRTFADRYWPGQDPLGRRIMPSWEGGDDPYWHTVVGVVEDVRHGGLDDEVRPELYLTQAQLPWAARSLTFMARTRNDPLTLVEPVRTALWGVDPNQATYEVLSMEQRVRESGSVLVSRILAVALTVFSGLALVLAALGLYGVISYGVAQRTYEIGVRTALGAHTGDVLRLVFREGLLMVLAGTALGLLGALAAGRVLASVLHGVAATDPVTFATTPLVLAAVALLAVWLPARRASRVDPLTALRTE